MQPLVLLDEPSRYHILVCVVLMGAKVDMVPAVRLERLLHDGFQLGGHLLYSHSLLLDLLLVLLPAPDLSEHAELLHSGYLALARARKPTQIVHFLFNFQF